MRMVYGRYLTPPEKEYILKQLEEEIAQGWVDQEIIPYLEELNRISGVVTTQSCAGHRDKDNQRDGYISIRLSERMNELWLRHIDYLFDPNRSFSLSLISVEQAWDAFQNAITGYEIACPRWVLWFVPEERDGFFKALIGFLSRLSQIDS